MRNEKELACWLAPSLSLRTRPFPAFSHIILQKEYDYLTSREAIVETIQANEYEFNEHGSFPARVEREVV